jgi:hypothetical protein
MARWPTFMAIWTAKVYNATTHFSGLKGLEVQHRPFDYAESRLETFFHNQKGDARLVTILCSCLFTESC